MKELKSKSNKETVKEQIKKKVEPTKQAKMIEKLENNTFNIVPLTLDHFSSINTSTFGNFRIWKNWFIKKFKRSDLIIIQMEFLNGDFGTLFVEASHEGFTYNKGLYLFDDDLKYYNFSLKTYCYDFHEGFCLPIKRRFDITALNRAIRGSDFEIELSTNPSVLQTFEESKMAKWVMKAQELFEEMQKWKTWIVICTLICVVHLILFCFKAGIFTEIGNLFQT